MRAKMSVAPPGANGQIMRIVLVGHGGPDCALAAAAPSARPAQAIAAAACARSGRCIEISARRTFDRGALHVPEVAVVDVADREVQRAAVVPDNDVVLLPRVPIDELRPRRMAVEIIDERLALLGREADELLHFLTEINRFLARFRMLAHD